MISHTTIGVNDANRARAFYGPVLASLGLVLKFSDATWAGWKQPDADRPLFIVTRPHDGEGATAGNGQMVALLASTRAAVDRCYEAAMEHGGTDEGAPGLRPHYHANYYGAYFRDPDGNKIGVACHSPE